MRKTVFEHFKIKNDIADGCMRFALRLSAGLLAALVLSAAVCNDKNSSIMPDVTLPPHGFRVDSAEPTAVHIRRPMQHQPLMQHRLSMQRLRAA